MLRMMRDILDQPQSLAGVVRYHQGEGRDALERAAALLGEPRRIVITGMGASLYAAMLLDYHLRSRGLASVAVDAGELLHFGGELARDATVVLVSRSGETIEALQLLPKLRALGATVIGITNVAGSTLERDVHLALRVNSGNDEAVAVQSYTGTAMVTLLLSALAAGEDRFEEAEQAVAEASNLLDACTRAEDRFRAFLDGARVVYVLGRGLSLASAHEGALLFNETAKLPSIAMASGGFRHGPVEVVDGDFRAFLLASQAATAALDDALRAHLKKMGGAVQTVAASGFFAPVLEVIPLQFAAYHAAELRGFTPGRFRYVTLVTTSETDFGPDGA